MFLMFKLPNGFHSFRSLTIFTFVCAVCSSLACVCVCVFFSRCFVRSHSGTVLCPHALNERKKCARASQTWSTLMRNVLTFTETHSGQRGSSNSNSTQHTASPYTNKQIHVVDAVFVRPFVQYGWLCVAATHIHHLLPIRQPATHWNCVYNYFKWHRTIKNKKLCATKALCCLNAKYKKRIRKK